jgi:anti-sigma regulatory factor (Ser/Thr protein kinase)
MEPVVDLTLPAGPEAPLRARRSLWELHSVLDPRVFQDLRLLVSELVTNSLRHAGLSARDVIRLRVSLPDGKVRVEVTDEGPGFSPAVETPSLFQESGWGLFLVRQLADAWGIRRNHDTCVWFELSRAV